MIRYIAQGVRLTLLCIIICIVLYPLAIRAVAYAAPQGGRGVTMISKGHVVGYALVGQSFNQDGYFWGRPSAVAYNAAGSAGSNKGPTNPDYLNDVKARVNSFLVHDPGVRVSDIPGDLVTASGSGLDPDISVEAARVQAARVAKARGIPEADVQLLIDSKVRGPLFGLFGTRYVRVLDLNLSLDDHSH